MIHVCFEGAQHVLPTGAVTIRLQHATAIVLPPVFTDGHNGPADVRGLEIEDHFGVVILFITLFEFGE